MYYQFVVVRAMDESSIIKSTIRMACVSVAFISALYARCFNIPFCKSDFEMAHVYFKVIL